MREYGGGFYWIFFTEKQLKILLGILNQIKELNLQKYTHKNAIMEELYKTKPQSQKNCTRSVTVLFKRGYYMMKIRRI